MHKASRRLPILGALLPQGSELSILLKPLPSGSHAIPLGNLFHSTGFLESELRRPIWDIMVEVLEESSHLSPMYWLKRLEHPL